MSLIKRYGSIFRLWSSYEVATYSKLWSQEKISRKCKSSSKRTWTIPRQRFDHWSCNGSELRKTDAKSCNKLRAATLQGLCIAFPSRAVLISIIVKISFETLVNFDLKTGHYQSCRSLSSSAKLKCQPSKNSDLTFKSVHRTRCLHILNTVQVVEIIDNAMEVCYNEVMYHQERYDFFIDADMRQFLLNKDKVSTIKHHRVILPSGDRNT